MTLPASVSPIERSSSSPAAPADRVRTFEALKDPTYRLLWAGGLVSFLAVQMEFIARGWLAFQLTGSNSGLGAVYLGFGVPMLLLTPWGGVIADRLDKRKVILGCQFAFALSSGFIAVGTSLGIIEYWMLIGTAVVQGAGFSFLGPARMAFTGEVVGPKRLANAIVLQQMSMNGTRIFGPSVAGALIGIAVFGVAGVYYLISGFMVLALLLTFRLPPAPRDAARELASPLAELAGGVRYVWGRPVLRLLVLTSWVVVMAAFPYVAFLPTLAEDIFEVGSSGYGLMSGASAVGALAASLYIASRAEGAQAWRIQSVAGVLFGVGVAMVGFSPLFGVALGVVLVTGAASSAFQALNNTLVLSNSEQGYHGRVQSLMMLSFSGFGLAALPLGIVADAVGLPRTLAGMGAVAVTAIAVNGVVRGRMRRRDADAFTSLAERDGSAPEPAPAA